MKALFSKRRLQHVSGGKSTLTIVPPLELLTLDMGKFFPLQLSVSYM